MVVLLKTWYKKSEKMPRDRWMSIPLSTICNLSNKLTTILTTVLKSRGFSYRPTSSSPSKKTTNCWHLHLVKLLSRVKNRKRRRGKETQRWGWCIS
jgi:hypothetical protein